MVIESPCLGLRSMVTACRRPCSNARQGVPHSLQHGASCSHGYLCQTRAYPFKKLNRVENTGSLPLVVAKVKGPQEDFSSAPSAAGNKDDAGADCYGTGMEVECIVPGYVEDEDIIDSSSATKAACSPSSIDEIVSEGQNLVGPRSSPVSQLLEVALLVSPFFFWGTSMVAMKELAPHTTPLLVAAWRLLPSGVILLAWASATGSKGPSSAMGWLAVGLFGLIDGACFQGFLAEGLQRTSAGLGSVIIDSQPLSVAIISSILFGETLGPVALIGLLLGVGGLVLLEVSPDVLDNFSIVQSAMDATGSMTSDISSYTMPEAAASSTTLWDSGEWWMLLAAQSMAVGTVMVRWVSKYADPIAATGWHMILGGIPLAVLAMNENTGVSFSDVFSGLDTKDFLLLTYVSVFGSAASYGVFFYLATVRGSLTQLSSLTFLTPMFAALGGYLVLGETLTPIQLSGALVTLVGVTCINAK